MVYDQPSSHAEAIQHFKNPKMLQEVLAKGTDERPSVCNFCKKENSGECFYPDGVLPEEGFCKDGFDLLMDNPEEIEFKVAEQLRKAA